MAPSPDKGETLSSRRDVADGRVGCGSGRLDESPVPTGQAFGPGSVLAVVARVDRSPGAWSCLDPMERQALARLRRDDDKAAYAMAHGLARMLFERMTGHPAAAMMLAYAPGGRPGIAGDHGHLQISLSHARKAVAVAIGWGVDVGIDVEVTTADEPDDATVELALTPRERQMVHTAGSAGERERLFLRLWTAKEAILKANGLGITAGLQAICLANGLEQPDVRQDIVRAENFQLTNWESGDIICSTAIGANLKRLMIEGASRVPPLAS